MEAEQLLREIVLDQDDVNDTSEALAFVLLKIDNGKWFHWENGALHRVVYPSVTSDEPTNTWSQNRARYRANLRRFKEENIDYLSSRTTDFSYSAGFLDAIGNKFLDAKEKCILETLPNDVNDEWLYLVQQFWRKLEDFIRQESKTYPFHVDNARRIVEGLKSLPVFSRINHPPREIPGLVEAAKFLFRQAFERDRRS